MGTGNHGDDLYKCINWLLNIYISIEDGERMCTCIIVRH